jgi:hypothetical protein
MIRLACALVTVAAVLACAAAPAAAQTITIGGRTYFTADALSLAAKLPLNPGVRAVLGIVRSCRGVQAYGFLSANGYGGGVAAWAPRNLLGCLEVSGGGPATGSRNPCLQAGRTPADQDPAGVANRPPTTRSYVAFAATSATACADISTQVPGGVWGQTTRAIPGLASGSVMLVKCQSETSQGLLDYLAEFRSRVPASKATFTLSDAYVGTGITRPLANVPSCSGTDLSF